MKRIIVAALASAALIGAGQSLAADMPVKALPQQPAAAIWGCYVGGNGGHGRAHKDWTFVPDTPVGSHTAEGWTAGGQIGCDWQANPNFVLGARVMYDRADLSGSNIETAFPGHTVNTQVKGFGTAVARAGWQANSNLLIYVLGGLAWVDDRHWEANRTTGLVEATNSTTRTGYDVGVGAEFLFTPNWSFFVEYDYMNFGTRRLTFACPPCGGGTEQYDVKQDLRKILVGLNWRWGGPVQARY